MTPNAIFRYRARTALKNHWQVALLVAFFAALPSILTQVAGVLTGGDLSTRLMALMNDTTFLSADPDTMIARLIASLTEGGATTYMLVSVLAWLVAPTLTLGMHVYHLNLLRGQAGEVSTVFSRLGSCVKVIGLTLLIAMKTFLWSVPGMVISLGGTALAATMTDSPDMAVSLMLSVMSVGYVLMFALMVAAMLRYAMAMFVLADAPETGLLQCIRRSKEIMKGRKVQLFVLELSFIIWNLLVMFIYTVLVSMFGPVIGLTVQMFLNLFVLAYQHCSIAAFFLQYQAGKEPEPIVIMPEELTDDKDDNPWNRSDE